MSQVVISHIQSSDKNQRRNSIVDAAGVCIERLGLAKTTLESVATEAGISRQTIYRYFSDRDELLVEALLAELDRSSSPDPVEEVIGRVKTSRDAVGALVESIVYTLQSIENNPRLSALLATEGDSVRSTLDGASQILFAHYREEMRPWIIMGQHNGLINEFLDADEISEWLLRVTLSLMTTEGPTPRSDQELTRFLFSFLEPVLISTKEPRTHLGP